MSADEHLSPQQFFHGSSHRLRVGELVEPGHEGHPQSSEAHVYMSAGPSVAHTFGDLSATRRGTKTYSVYKVAPTGPVEPDPDGPGFRSGQPLRVTGVHERARSSGGSEPWWNQ